MALKAGYKQTDIGPIPEDWELAPLGHRGAFRKGSGVRKDQANSGDIPCVRYGELYTDHHEIIRHFPSRVSEEVANTARLLRKGDIVFAASGETKGEIGKCAAFVDDFRAVAGGDTILFSPAQDDPRFLGYALNQPVAVKQKAARGQGDAVVHISTKALQELVLPLPPKSEQRAIAVALGEVDAAIEALKSLIAKKRDLRTAAMQRLIMGEVRLPGFSAPWQERRFGDFAFLRGQKVIVSDLAAGTPCIELDQITSGTGRIVSMGSASGKTIKNKFLPGDVLFGRLRAYLRKYWLADRSGVCSTEIWPIVAKEDNSTPEFLFYVIQRPDFLDAATQSYGTHMPRSDWNIVKNLKLSIPQVDEQAAIARALRDMDSEIGALEDRLTKSKALKQAMMQALLTGRVRLPVADVERADKEPAHA